MEIRFSRIEDGEFSPFDLGNMKILHQNKEIDSGEKSQHAMMIFIAISDFINELIASREGKREREFVGADSSFSIKLKGDRDGVQFVRNKVVMKCAWKEVFEATIGGLSEILSKYEKEIDWSQAVFADLSDAKMNLEKTLGDIR